MPPREKVTRPQLAEMCGLTNVNSLKHHKWMPRPDAPSELINGVWVTCWYRSTADKIVKERERRHRVGKGWRHGQLGDNGRWSAEARAKTA